MRGTPGCGRWSEHGSAARAETFGCRADRPSRTVERVLGATMRPMPHCPNATLKRCDGSCRLCAAARRSMIGELRGFDPERS